MGAPNEVAPFCHYCGSQNMIQTGEEAFRPATVIPFQLTKEQAITNYVDTLSKVKFLPPDLKQQEYLNGFRGIYIPYYRYNYDAQGNATLSVSEDRNVGGRRHEVTEYENRYQVSGSFHVNDKDAELALDDSITQQIATDRIPGTWQVLIHPFKLDHTKKEIAKPVEVQLNADGSVSGAQTGTWSVQEGTSYFTIKLGTTEYKGVMVEQTLEPSDDKAASFTVMNRNGVTVWGYQTSPATGIQNVMVNDPCSIFDDAWYDLRGHRITTPTKKGIYIHNGKKVIR